MTQQKKIAIVQSNYIPWKGYFDMIGLVDEFILYDDVQYAKRHWHNRNKIKISNGTQWLTIPVDTKGKYLQNIDDVQISGPWSDKHWRAIEFNYRKADFFAEYADRVKELYKQASKLKLLSQVNHLFLSTVCEMLGVKTRLSWSRDYSASGVKTDRLLSICQAAGATSYLSGPSAQDYFELEKFYQAGIEVEWMDYSGYSEYPQLYGRFDHAVSALDLLFNCGPKAPLYMKFVRS